MGTGFTAWRDRELSGWLAVQWVCSMRSLAFTIIMIPADEHGGFGDWITTVALAKSSQTVDHVRRLCKYGTVLMHSNEVRNYLP